MTLFLNIVLIAILQQVIDATALNFTIAKNSIVQAGRWKIKATNTSEINQFVNNHIKEIDPDKILSMATMIPNTQVSSLLSRF